MAKEKSERLLLEFLIHGLSPHRLCPWFDSRWCTWLYLPSHFTLLPNVSPPKCCQSVHVIQCVGSELLQQEQQQEQEQQQQYMPLPNAVTSC